MSIEWVYARQQLDSVIEKLLSRTDAFQSITVVPPLTQLFLALDSFKESASQTELDAVLSFIDDSLAHFMHRRFGIIDEALSLGVQDELNATLSFVILAFRYHWKTLAASGPTTVTAVSQWLADFLLRLYYIGEHSTLISNFICEIQSRQGHPISDPEDQAMLSSTARPENLRRPMQKLRYHR